MEATLMSINRWMDKEERSCGTYTQWNIVVKLISRVRFFVTPWTVAHQAPPSMEFSRQEYWSRLPFPSPSGILLSHKRECIWISSNEMDEPRAYYAEWNKSEREREIWYTNRYMWNLERWYWWIYLHSSNGETDLENRWTQEEGRRVRVRCMDRVTWKLIITYVK